jgi:hypothetical protein
MSIIDNPDARPVAYAYSDLPEPGLYREPGFYPEPPAALQAKALPFGKGALAAILLGTVAVGAALGFAVFDFTGSQPRPAVVVPSNGSPDSRPPAAPAPDPGQAVPAPDPGQAVPAPDPGQAVPAPPAASDPGPVAAAPAPAPAPPAASDPGPVAAAPAPAPAPGNTNVIVGGGIVGGGGGHPRDHGPHPHCHLVPQGFGKPPKLECF